MLFDVYVKRIGIGKLTFTVITDVFEQSRVTFLLLVYLHVLQEAVFGVTPLIADFAHERLLAGIFQQVFIEQCGVDETFFTDVTLVRFLVVGDMRSHVIVQVVFFGEAPRAELTFERTIFNVGS